MNIQLITGLTIYEAGVNTIKQIDVNDFEKENLVIVPDSFSMQAENLIFDVLKIKSSFNINVVGVSKLASKILRDQNIPYQRISGLDEVFTIYKVVKECEKDFQYFSKCGIDFCQKILQIIKQFKSCKISYKALKTVGNENLDKKISDLRMIYEKYEQMLGEKLDLSKLLEFSIKNAHSYENLKNYNLFFVNFDSFSLEIHDFICKLSKYVNQVFIGQAVPTSSQKNAYIYEDDIHKKTMSLAKENSVMVQVQNNQTNLTGERLKMAQNLFAFDVEQGKSDFFVNVQAKNMNDEIEFVAKKIKYDVYNGARFKDFAVAVAGPEYYEKIKNVFSQYDLTFYCDDALDLSQTILGKFLTKIINIAKVGFSQESFEFLVSHPFLSTDETLQILKDIKFYVVEDEQEFLQRFCSYEKIISLIKKLSFAKKMQNFTEILKEIVDFVSEKHKNVLNLISDDKLYKKESENSQAENLIIEVLDRLSEIGKDENFDIVDFESIFLLATKSVKVETVPSYIDAIFIGDVSNSYFQDVSTLFVLGATESSMPKMRADVGIIDDDDIEKLRLNFILEPQISVLNRRSRLKLFECLQHATKRLYVCTPSVEGGKLVEKASFVGDLKKMFGNGTDENVLQTVQLEDIDFAGFSKDERCEALKMFVGIAKNSRFAFAYLKNKKKLPVAFYGTMKELCGETKIEERKNSNLQIDNACDVFFTRNHFSVTQLETYFKCPFRHFVTYGLKIKENENIDPNAKQFGILAHELLHKFVEENVDNLKNLTDDDVENFLKINLIEIAKRIYDEKVIKKTYFVKFLHRASKIILQRAVFEQKYSNFTPVAFEKKIVKNFYKNLSFVGYVDRVDEFENYFRVIDYKTGQISPIENDLLNGKKLQLVLYAMTLKEELKKDCSGIYYFDCKHKYGKVGSGEKILTGLTLADNDVVYASDFRLDDENFKSNILGTLRKKSSKKGEFAFKYLPNKVSLEAEFDYAQKISCQAIDEIMGGYIEAKPFKNECERCPFSSICGHREIDGERKEIRKRKEDE